MKFQMKLLAISAVIGGLALQQAFATTIGVNLGTVNPPGTLGGYTTSSYDPGSMGGQSYYEYMVNGNGGAALNRGEGTRSTWGQNYTGNVYALLGTGTLTLNLRGGVEAVYFYEEPDQYSESTMTATDSSDTQVTTTVNGYYGSAGVGFYESVARGPDYLTQITVTCSDTTGFAISKFGPRGGQLSGTFGGAIPETGWTWAMLAIGSGMVVGYLGWFSLLGYKSTKALNVKRVQPKRLDFFVGRNNGNTANRAASPQRNDKTYT